MLSFYRASPGNRMEQIETPEQGCWVRLVAPTKDELSYVSETLGADPEFLRAALDEEETSRIEVDEGQTLILVDFPHKQEPDENGAGTYTTLPMGILVLENHVVTIALEETTVLRGLAEGSARGVNTAFKSNFVLQILLRLSKRYLYYLREVNKTSDQVERQLHKSMRNKELYQLLELEKGLVYFSTSLKSVDMTIKKIMTGKVVKLYEEDDDLLDDVAIEIAQAMEMANIYSSILSGTMDAFASVISNNLNIVMKVLTSLTIVLTIPNIVFSFYGMNVSGLPGSTAWVPAIVAAVVTLGTWLVLKKKDLI